MSVTYELNAAGARANTLSTRIVEKGAYVGKFTLAQAVTAKSGSQGIEFSFRSDTGQTADYLTLWTHNSYGKELYGRKIIDAILTCMKVRRISTVSRQVTRRASGGATQTVMADLFPDLMDKPIGLFLVVEEYEKTDGAIGSKMVIVMPFEASTSQTASEILDNRDATSFDGILRAIRDRPVQKRNRQSSPSAPVNLDDDIPF